MGEKPGDWYCPNCNDLQFARNPKCRKCGTPNPANLGALEAAGLAGSFKGVGSAFAANTEALKQGDWHCSNCEETQPAANTACRQCQTPNFKLLFMQGRSTRNVMDMIMDVINETARSSPY